LRDRGYVVANVLNEEIKIVMGMRYFCVIGFYNEADTVESSSILIYSKSKLGLYTQS
jgi:hypothetical protein